jgi:hypothetical protein
VSLRGGQQINFLLELVRSPCHIFKLYDNPFWEKVTGGESRKKERKRIRIKNVNSGH